MSRQKSWRLASVALLAVVCGTSACHRQSGALAPDAREAIQSRASTIFENAILFKPSEAGLENPLHVRPAPLIVQEVINTNTALLWQDQFGSPDSPPTVASATGFITVNGRPHQQFTYTWIYSSTNLPNSAARIIQGVRLTLDRTDAPVIWEVFADSSGAEIIYVAEALEQAARAEFGPPLEGRKFSIERGVTETPAVVVANVISDGPLPMGPIVYLRGVSRDVSALICRCMPAQSRTLASQKDYVVGQNTTNSWRDAEFPKAPLNQRLRLPSQF